MKRILTIAILFAFASVGQAQQAKYYLNDDGTVELRGSNAVASTTTATVSKLPPLRSDSNSVESSKIELVAKPKIKAEPVCGCDVCTCASKANTTTAKIVKPQTIKAPMDHTHTCSEGHTWDHSMDGGTHICPFCGEKQVYQDKRMRPVTTSTPAQVETYTIPSSSATVSGGCANGQCSSASTAWYPGKNLRRR